MFCLIIPNHPTAILLHPTKKSLKKETDMNTAFVSFSLRYWGVELLSVVDREGLTSWAGGTEGSSSETSSCFNSGTIGSWVGSLERESVSNELITSKSRSESSPQPRSNSCNSSMEEWHKSGIHTWLNSVDFFWSDVLSRMRRRRCRLACFLNILGFYSIEEEEESVLVGEWRWNGLFMIWCRWKK